jgi:hypothetical protein
MSKARLVFLAAFIILTFQRSVQSAETGDGHADPHVTIRFVGDRQPDPHAIIVRYLVDPEAPGSKDISAPGALHIIYSDGAQADISVTPQPDLKDDFDRITGFSNLGLSTDRKSFGFTELHGNCCTSYDIPLQFLVYRDGKIVLSSDEGPMVWDWMFLKAGSQVAIMWGPTHGSESGYELYALPSGKRLAKISPDYDSDNHYIGLKADAPAWAKTLNKHENSPKDRPDGDLDLSHNEATP